MDSKHIRDISELYAAADDVRIITDHLDEVRGAVSGTGIGHVKLSDQLNTAARTLIYGTPLAGVESRLMTTTNTADVVPSHHISSFQHAIYHTGLLGKLGVETVQEKFAADNYVPTIGKPTHEWLGEDEAVTKMTVTTGRIDFAAHLVGSGLSITRKLANMTLNPATSLNAEGELQRALVWALQEAATQAFINGTGADNQPLGVLGNADIHSTTATGSISPTDIFTAIEKLETEGIDLSMCSLIASPEIKKALCIALHGQQRVWDSTGVNTANLHASTHVPAGTILIGDFSPAKVHMRAGDAIDLKMVRASANDRRDLYAFHDMDVLVREPKAFSKIITN